MAALQLPRWDSRNQAKEFVMSNLVRIAALAALLLTPFSARAEQAAPPADPAQAAMPCPHAGKEGCCGGACPGMQAQAGAAGQAAPAQEGGCPCQKARAAAAKAAEAAKQAPQ
jgi:hypothetical protein